MLVVATETKGTSASSGVLQQACPESLPHAPAAQHSFRPAQAAVLHASSHHHEAVE